MAELDWPDDSNEMDEGAVAGAALIAVVGALGQRATKEMAADATGSLVVEAAKLLAGVLGFACEGFVPPLLRGRAIIRGVHCLAWKGLVPHALLGQWFDLPRLLGVFCGDPLRKGYDAAPQAARLEFLSALSRVASLEQLGPNRSGASGLVGPGFLGGGRALLRSAWGNVIDKFPEVRKLRALSAHIRQRCWEDARDRSRSRSRSRDRRKRAERKGSDEQTALPPDAVRFFVKGFGTIDDCLVQKHFARFGVLVECNVLRDKRTKRSRGMAFVTLQPEGTYRGVRNTRQMLKEWVLTNHHEVKGVVLEVSEAEEKTGEDDEQKREERVEERRRQRIEREQRGMVQEPIAERLVLSPWAKRWRREIWESLPKASQGPAALTDPKVQMLGRALWHEVSKHAIHTGDKDVLDALAFFRAEGFDTDVHTEPWVSIPLQDMLLLVGEGVVGITVEGIFAAEVPKDPVVPTGGSDLATMDSLASASVPTALASASPVIPPGPTRLVERGGSDHEKIFVGGLTPGTTLDMLTSYFSCYGTITDAVVMMDRVTGKPRGFGFVVFENVGIVDAVLHNHGKHRIDNKWVDVKRATPQAELPADVGSTPDVMIHAAVPPPRLESCKYGSDASGADASGPHAPRLFSEGSSIQRVAIAEFTLPKLFALPTSDDCAS